MGQRAHFIVELWRRDRRGLALYGVGAASVLFCLLAFDYIGRIPKGIYISVWLVGFISIPWAAFRLRKSTSRLHQERQAERSARSATPWDPIPESEQHRRHDA